MASFDFPNMIKLAECFHSCFIACDMLLFLIILEWIASIQVARCIKFKLKSQFHNWLMIVESAIVVTDSHSMCICKLTHVLSVAQQIAVGRFSAYFGKRSIVPLNELDNFLIRMLLMKLNEHFPFNPIRKISNF